eukprot:767299-Hanusia_phi.AAC.2
MISQLAAVTVPYGEPENRSRLMPGHCQTARPAGVNNRNSEAARPESHWRHAAKTGPRRHSVQ